MFLYSNKINIENKKKTYDGNSCQQKTDIQANNKFVDNRPLAIQQRRLQYTIRNRNTQFQLKKQKKAPPIQRTTVVYETSSMNDYDDVKNDAQIFHTHKGKGAFLDTKNNRITGSGVGDTHIDVHAHGNQESIGNYDDTDELRKNLKEQAKKAKMEKIFSVTLHSCMSAAPHPKTGELLIDKLHNSFRDTFSYIDVKGFEDEVIIDTNGNPRVLKDGKTMGEYKLAARTATNHANLIDQFFNAIDQRAITSGDQTLDMYMKSQKQLLDEKDYSQVNVDPKVYRQSRIDEARKQLEYTSRECDDWEDVDLVNETLSKDQTESEKESEERYEKRKKGTSILMVS